MLLGQLLRASSFPGTLAHEEPRLIFPHATAAMESIYSTKANLVLACLINNFFICKRCKRQRISKCTKTWFAWADLRFKCQKILGFQINTVFLKELRKTAVLSRKFDLDFRPD